MTSPRSATPTEGTAQPARAKRIWSRFRGRGRLLRSAAWVVIGRISFTAAGLILTIVTARLLGPADRGVLTLSILGGAFASLVPRAIWAALAHRLALVARKGGDQAEAASVTRDAWMFAFGAGLLAIVVACPLTVVLSGDRQVALGAVGIVAASIVIAGPIGVATGVSVAGERMARYALATAGYQVGALVGALTAAAVAGGTLLPISIGWAIGALLGAVVSVPPAVAATVWTATSGGTLRHQAHYTIRQSGALLLTLASGRLDVILLGALSGTSAVGLYSVAVGASELVLFLGSALETSLYSRIGISDAADAWRLARRVAAYSMGVAAAQGAILAAVAHPLMAFVFGEQFRSSGDYLDILVVGTVFISGQGALVAYFLNNLGRPTASLGLATVNVVATALGCLLLIPSLEAQGAAIAAASGYCISFLCAAWLMWRVRPGLVAT